MFKYSEVANMKTPNNKAMLHENESADTAAIHPESAEAKRKQNELKQMIDSYESYMDHFKNILHQQYEQQLKERKEFDEGLEKRSFSELKSQSDELWKAYLANQVNISKLNEYHESLKKSLMELAKLLNDKINYLRNFIENINKDIHKIDERMNVRKDKIIAQYNDELRNAYPKMIVEQIISHLDNTVYQKFRNNQISAGQLHQAVLNELASPGLNILAKNPKVDEDRLTRNIPTFLNKLEKSIEDNAELHADILKETEDENLKLLNELFLASVEQQLESCKSQSSKVDQAIVSLNNAEGNISVEIEISATKIATEVMTDMDKIHSVYQGQLDSCEKKVDDFISQSKQQREQLDNKNEELKSQDNTHSTKLGG